MSLKRHVLNRRFCILFVFWEIPISLAKEIQESFNSLCYFYSLHGNLYVYKLKQNKTLWTGVGSGLLISMSH